MTFLDWVRQRELPAVRFNPDARRECPAARCIDATENGRSCRRCSRTRLDGAARSVLRRHTALACGPGGPGRREKEHPARPPSDRDPLRLRGSNRGGREEIASIPRSVGLSRAKRGGGAGGGGPTFGG